LNHSNKQATGNLGRAIKILIYPQIQNQTFLSSRKEGKIVNRNPVPNTAQLKLYPEK